MFFGNALLTRVFLYAGRAILRFTACVNKKAGERRREIHFTLKIHDFWKLQSRDIHSQMKPLILYNRGLWELLSHDIYSQMKPLIIYNRGLWKLQSCDRCYRMNLLPSIIHSFGNCALVRASVKWCILGGKHIEFTGQTH